MYHGQGVRTFQHRRMPAFRGQRVHVGKQRDYVTCLGLHPGLILLEVVQSHEVVTPWDHTLSLGEA